MDREQAMKYIGQALEKALKKDGVAFGPSTDLIGEEIIDSLDSMVFILELAELTGKEFPDLELVENDFFKVDRLVSYLTTA